MFKNQKGAAPVLILVAVVGVVLFLLLANTAGFKDKLFSTLFPKPASNAQEEQDKNLPEFLSNQLLVKVKKGVVGVSSINNLAKDVKVKSFERVAGSDKNTITNEELFSWYLLTLDTPQEKAVGKLDVTQQRLQAKFADKNNPSKNNNQAVAKLQAVINKLRDDPNIEALDLNYLVQTQTTPNDPYYLSSGSWGQAFSDLWGLHKISLEPAWDQTKGSALVIVANIDTGVDRNHPDMAANMWINSKETPGNNIDDDGNGYIDDYYGCNFIGMSGNVCKDPMDDNGHGSHTAGTIAGVGNNGLGVVGVNWSSKIMALKFLNSNGSGQLSDGIKALQYAADMGAKISSNSWGCQCQSPAMDDAVKYGHDKGMVVVVAAGNNNLDALDFSPASADYAITVGASDPTDLKAQFSNWGEKIDVVAPGVDILSIRAAANTMCTATRTVGTNYCRVSGTSMATPHVAGLAALLYSKNAALSNEEIRQILRKSAADLGASGKDPNFGFGRIEASGAMNNATSHLLAPVISNPKSRSIIFGSNVNFSGMVPGPNFVSYKLEAGLGRTPASWVTFANSSIQPVTTTNLASVDTTKLNDGAYIFRLTATDSAGKSYLFQIGDVIVDNFDINISLPNILVSQGLSDIVGTIQAKNGLVLANYKLEWGLGSSPGTWSTSGITLVSGGTQAVTNGKLGSWDTSALTNGQSYTLRLTGQSTSGSTSQTSVVVKVDNTLVVGWPKKLPLSNKLYTIPVLTPVLADLNGDGQKEVIVTSQNNQIQAFNANGTNYPGFPVAVDPGYLFNQPVNVADIDNDGKKEIIASAVNTNVSGSLKGRKLYILRSDGSLYPGWPIPLLSGSDDFSDETATIADIDNDGVKELLVMELGTSSIKLHAYHLNGSEVIRFPLVFANSNTSTIFTGPSVADLDEDGNVEIGFSNKDTYYLLDNQGNTLPGWPYKLPLINGQAPAAFGSLAFGDIDGDFKKEIFSIATQANCGGCNGLLYGFRKDGSQLTGWPQQLGPIYYNGNFIPTPSVGDYDKDGKDEVIVGSGNIYVFGLNGLKFKSVLSGAASAPAVADIDNDNKLEFASAYGNAVGLVNDDGSTFWQAALSGVSVSGLAFTSPVTMSDLKSSSKMNLAAVWGPFTNFEAYLYLWELPGTANPNVSNQWPMFGQNSARTSMLSLDGTSCSTGILNTLGSLVGINTCPPPPPTPSPTLTPNPTPTPTLSPSPSPTLIPSAIPTPTSTPTPIDTTPPNITITNPINGATITRNSNFTILASVSDNIAVAKVEFYIDGGLKCTDTLASYSCSTKIGGKPNSAHTILAKAIDTFGNSSTHSITITVR